MLLVRLELGGLLLVMLLSIRLLLYRSLVLVVIALGTVTLIGWQDEDITSSAFDRCAWQYGIDEHVKD
jgi:hypothetical protein